MVRITRPRIGSRTFRIRKRFGIARVTLHQVFPAVSVVLSLAGSILLWFASAVEAGVTQWNPVGAMKQVSVGSSSTCAIGFDNKAYCWGSNTTGQLGNNSTTQSDVPVAVDTTGVLSGKTILSISAGQSHTCAIASDNQAYCWGADSTGQLGNNSTTQSLVPVAVDTTGVLSGKTILSISAGQSHTCAIASDNKAYCWGADGNGQLGNNSTLQSNVPVAVNTTGVLAGKTVLSISAGSSHTCAIASDNLAYCWGDDSAGQLGNNSTAQSNIPVAVDTTGVLSGKTATSISAGNAYTCAIASDNQAYCWGYNSSGNLGNNSTTASPVPVTVNTAGVLSGKTILSISVGGISRHTCAIASDNQAYCWGSGYSGELGNNSSSEYHDPVAVNTAGVLSGKTILSISADGNHTCAIASDNRVYCWGDNTNGQLGDNTTTQRLVPVTVRSTGLFEATDYRLYANADSATPGSALAGVDTSAPLTSYGEAFRVRTGVKSVPNLTGLTNGSSTTCTLSAGNVYCWGRGTEGELGNNAASTIYMPIAVDTTGALSGKTVSSVKVGLQHVCAIASDGNAYCWGDNTNGQLGNNSTTQSNVPVAVDTSGVLSGKTILSISTGGNTTCVVASDNKVYCWGLNAAGQLGNNSLTESHVPVAVDTTGALSGKTMVSISVADDHTCATATDGSAYCWGNNFRGMLGNNSTTSSQVPVAVDTTGALSGKTVRSISAGAANTCAIASDNNAYCWGWNYYGQIGDGTGLDSSVPVAVDTSGALSGKTVMSISAGQVYGYEVCAVASDSHAYCWGQHGGGTSDSTVPVAVDTSGVLSGKSIVSISVGDSYACLLDSNAQAYCLGQDYAGELGIGYAVARVDTPSAVIVDPYIPGADILPTDNTYKLQYAQKTVSTCSTQTGFTDVTASTPIAFNTNPSVTNGASITTNANDPVPTTDSVAQIYVSSPGGFTNTSTIPGGKTGLWDFSLKDNSGTYSTSYCLRLAYGDGTAIDFATQYPEIQTVAQKVTLLTASRFYQNADSATPGSPLAITNTAPTLSSAGQAFRVRAGLKTDQQPALSGKTIASVSAGSHQTCVVASDNKAYCWGDNSTGQLGTGDTTNSLAPIAVDASGVLSGKTVTQIATGVSHTCALASDGTVYCWGDNSNGQLGDGSTVQSNIPVAVDTTGVLSGVTIQAITAGNSFSCALSTTGAVYCWGKDGVGQLGNNDYNDSLTPVAIDVSGVLSGKTVTKVSAGDATACVLTSDAAAFCWGEGYNGELGDGSYYRSLVPVAITMSGALAGKTIIDLSVGGGHACVLASDNKPYCWGFGTYGQLGNGGTGSQSAAVAVDASGVLSGKTLHGLESGYEGSCVLDASNNIYCWGMGSHGELGNGVSSDSSVPVAVTMTGALSGKTVSTIDSGFGDTTTGAHSVCAQTTDGLMYCWGSDSNGQLGDDGTTDSNVAVAVLMNAYNYRADLIASANAYKLQYAQKTVSTCSTQTGFADVTASTPIAFNTNPSVTNGASITTNANDPVPTTDSVAQTYISAVGAFTNTSTIPGGKTGLWDFSLKDNSGLNNTSYCFRIVYSDGAAFTGAMVYPEVTTMVNIEGKQSSYRYYQNVDSATPGTPLAATDTKAVLTTPNEAFRTRMGIMPLPKFSNLTTGYDVSCATVSGKAYCWGDDSTGQLGNNSTSSSNVPVAVDTTGVLSGKTILSIATGGTHTCAIASDNLAYCWGDNTHGQLGNNSTTQANSPVAVDISGVLSGKTILSISTGHYHTCVIASDNKAYCWGYDLYGQLGNNSTTESHVPVAVNDSGVLSGKTILSISTGGRNTCVIASDNQAYCWGDDTYGQLGNNSTAQTNVPVAIYTSGVLSGKTILSISTGGINTCAIASDNQAYCWGSNFYGQVGDNTNNATTIPVAVYTSGVLSGKTILSIVVDDGSGYQTCAIASDYQAYCWGRNDTGELGIGGTSNTNVPVAVSTSGVLFAKTLTAIQSDSGHTCVLDTAGVAYCWGLNWVGQVGAGYSGGTVTVPDTVLTDGTMPAVDITNSVNGYKLQYAEKTVGACSAQTGFADVTGSTPIAFNTNGSVSNGASITSNANDPVSTADSIPQAYISASGTFTNSSTINAGKVGLWDFSLKDNSAPYNTSYCLRIAYSDGSAFAGSVAFSELRTTLGVLSIDFVDGSGTTISQPAFSFTSKSVKTLSSQTSTGTFGDSTHQLHVYNDITTNGWNVSLAPTAGPTALWNRSDNLAKYDVNDSGPNATDSGVDADNLGGQMSLNPSAGTIASACSLTGTSLGSSSSFVEGSVNSITLMSASSAAAMGCDWDYSGASLSQTIPAAQPAGAYTIDITATVVAL